MAKVVVENVNTPGQTTNLDADKYGAMLDAVMAVLSAEPLNYAQIKSDVLQVLSQDHFPDGKTAGWWLKSVQLDQEAKGTIIRHATKPLTWSKA